MSLEWCLILILAAWLASIYLVLIVWCESDFIDSKDVHFIVALAPVLGALTLAVFAWELSKKAANWLRARIRKIRGVA